MGEHIQIDNMEQSARLTALKFRLEISYDDATNEITTDKSQKVVLTTNEASCADPSSEALFEDISHKVNIEGSSKPDITMDDNSVGDQESGRSDAIDALFISLGFHLIVATKAPKSLLTHFAMQEMEDVVPDHQNCANDQAASVGSNELRPENAEKCYQRVKNQLTLKTSNLLLKLLEMLPLPMRIQ
ncbi:hypothetical protein QQ045_022157 [Rhodiola kirilowii]